MSQQLTWKSLISYRNWRLCYTNACSNSTVVWNHCRSNSPNSSKMLLIRALITFEFQSIFYWYSEHLASDLQSDQLADNPSRHESNLGWNGFPRGACTAAHWTQTTQSWKDTNAEQMSEASQNGQDISYPWHCQIKLWFCCSVTAEAADYLLHVVFMLLISGVGGLFVFSSRKWLLLTFHGALSMKHNHSSTSHIPRHRQHPPLAPSEVESVSEVTPWINGPINADSNLYTSPWCLWKCCTDWLVNKAFVMTLYVKCRYS